MAAKKRLRTSIHIITSSVSGTIFSASFFILFNHNWIWEGGGLVTTRKRSCGKVMFLQVSVILSTGGHAWLPGGHAWLRGGGWDGCWGACVVPRGTCMVAGACVVVGGMRGCRWGCMVAGRCARLLGACMVAGGALLLGGMHGCQGACMVAEGCMVAGGHAWLPGGHVWLPGACVVAGGACMVIGGVCGRRGGGRA